jgi:GSH-dependent disulfide-bond oxidoreductase
MITLFGCGSPNVHKVLLMLAETGLDYDFRSVPLYDGTLAALEFRAMAPNGRLPVLVDDGVAISESGAILTHLAEKTGRLLAREGRDRDGALQWLMWQMAGVGPMFGQALHFLFIAPGTNDYAKGRYLREVNRLYDVADARLAVSLYLGGADYSIADIAAIPWLRNYVKTLGIDMTNRPHVLDWIARIEARPAWIATEAESKRLFKADLVAQKDATPGQRAAFFGMEADTAA